MTEQEVRRYLRQMKDESSEQAFRGFYDLTYDRLFRIAYYYVKREEWAQEIVLDVFMRLWDQRKKLPEINNIEDYCFILTKNASLNYLEKEPKHMPQSSGQLSESTSHTDSPEETLISDELFARYVKALDRLPERCREIFVMSKLKGMKYREIAGALGISQNTVEGQMAIALKKLREELRHCLPLLLLLSV